MGKFLGFYFGAERLEKQHSDILYNHIVASARNPMLYGDTAAPDTANGRFELIMLHIFLVFRRLQDPDQKIQSIKQKTFDRFLEDMDVNLREIGVGPDGVPKRIQKMLENFYGRAAAYQDAIESNDVAQITEVVARNFYSDQNQNDIGAKKISNYFQDAVAIMDDTPLSDIIISSFSFTK